MPRTGSEREHTCCVGLSQNRQGAGGQWALGSEKNISSILTSCSPGLGDFWFLSVVMHSCINLQLIKIYRNKKCLPHPSCRYCCRATQTGEEMSFLLIKCFGSQKMKPKTVQVSHLGPVWVSLSPGILSLDLQTRLEQPTGFPFSVSRKVTRTVFIVSRQQILMLKKKCQDR